VRATEDGSEAILCDPSRMQQVIWNLLSNAIKFTPTGGRVTIGEAREGSMVVLRVTDTGAGIEPEFLPHVFDRFRQQDPASTRKHGGLGLGLSIVRNLVELHGGTISAESEGAGRGATFTVRVPMAAAYPDRSEGLGPRTVARFPSLDGVRVLVVDNEADARGLIGAILGNCGAEVIAVDSAAEAITEIQRHRPDVLVSDIAMPGEDGYSLIRKVRRLGGSDPPLPAAALTAFATTTDRAQALMAGYQAHLAKPVEPSELTTVVAALAGRNS
jgi:CheY-like chemotaxis protein